MSNIDKDIFNKLKERMQAKFSILLDGYLRDAKTYMVTIETNISGDNVAELINAAHSLKSASGLLGILEVHKAAEKIEYMAKELHEKGEKNLQSLSPHYHVLQNEFSTIEGDLRAELEKAKVT